ncbi:MAG: S8 family serine peptidase [Alphaproteobacteria bacterium]
MTTQLLIKAHPGADRAQIKMGARAVKFELETLLPNIEAGRARRLGATAAPIWKLATTETDGVNPWDACHRLMQDGLGVSGPSSVTFAEPDFEQGWLWSTDDRQALAMSGDCDAPEPPDPDVYAVGPTKFWFRENDFSQLEAARAAVGDPSADTVVRIAHLDTGYDRDHVTLPAHLRTDLQKNYADKDRPCNDATDQPMAIINPMLGHGTATIALLAGTQFEGAPLGGAPQAEVVPIRVANWVVLFKNSAIARALDYVHGLWNDPAKRVHVVTMSMGGLASSAWADAINALYERGVFVVTAAGNNFGNLPTHYTVYPARFRRVVAACGVMANGQPYADLPIRKMAGCYGPKKKRRTSMAAYTPNVPWARYGCNDTVDRDGGGTSSATPQIAAAAALWAQKNAAALDGYSQGWMRVEAIRHALFESAEKVDGKVDKWLGQGVLRANDALAIAPAAESALEAERKDKASFPILKVLFGLGVTSISRDQQEMLELEALQLTQQSADIEELLEDLDPADDEIVESRNRDRILMALAESPRASSALKSLIATALGSDAPRPIPRPMADMPPPSVMQSVLDDIPPPPVRRINVYAFDPSLGTKIETFHLNEAVIDVPWENDLKPGPVGEYLEIVDIDPSSNAAYHPVDLNHPSILAQQGLPPSEGNPQFHQQMVYGVAMKTIKHFERALGRVSLWAERKEAVEGEWDHRFVRRLRVYPHALREANAYYSPDKKALLFGYFTASGDKVGSNLPGGTVFTCLSHDIVAHETSHALLDGLHPFFREPTNPDMLAFHEAFSDIVALFQHFTMPEALRHEVAKTGGDLSTATLLGGLAHQFGEAIGHRGALRDAIGRRDEDNKWIPHKPRQSEYLDARKRGPHQLGAVLVAAVFDAFVRLYDHRTRDLIRLATGGTGVLPQGEIPADLTQRLAREAAKLAGQIMTICIRALDYCPPIDLTFGEYLRALITADRDLMPSDDRAYRVAFVDAFRARGIFPPGVRNLSVETLAWNPPDVRFEGLDEVFRDLAPRWQVQTDRFEAYTSWNKSARALYNKLVKRSEHEAAFAAMGLVRTSRTLTIDGEKGKVSPIQVHSLRPCRRISPDGDLLEDVVIEMTQRWKPEGSERGEFYRGGCTVICDGRTGKVRYIIRKRIGHRGRKQAEQKFKQGLRKTRPGANYLAMADDGNEPFALMHRGGQEVEYEEIE